MGQNEQSWGPIFVTYILGLFLKACSNDVGLYSHDRKKADFIFHHNVDFVGVGVGVGVAEGDLRQRRHFHTPFFVLCLSRKC